MKLKGSSKLRGGGERGELKQLKKKQEREEREGRQAPSTMQKQLKQKKGVVGQILGKQIRNIIYKHFYTYITTGNTASSLRYT